MVSNPVWQWIFTIVFAAITVSLAAQLVSGRRRPLLTIGNAFHLLMAVVMLAMVWPWWRAIAWLPQLVVFAVATVWFLAVWLGQVLGRFEQDQLGGHPAWHQLVHALMMGSMTWMVAVMPPMPHGAGHAHSMSTLGIVAGIVLTALLLITAVLLAVDAFPRRHCRTSHLVDTVTMVAMLAGMAAMCWLMVA